MKRKYTNTPSGTAQREEYSGMMRFNGGTGYKNRDWLIELGLWLWDYG